MKTNSIKKIIDKKNKLKFLSIALLCLVFVGGLAHSLGVYSLAGDSQGSVEISSEDGEANPEDGGSSNTQDEENTQSDDASEGEGAEKDEDLESDETQGQGSEGGVGDELEEEPEDTPLQSIEVSFSFDGEYQNQLMLLAEYRNQNIEWEYTLDSDDWITSTTDTVALTDEQVASINATDDIRVSIVGKRKEENIYTIDISQSTEPTDIYVNDKENLLFGYHSDTMEWSLVGESSWMQAEITADMLEDKVGYLIRNRATGVYMASDSVTAYFTVESYEEERSYLPLEYQSITDYSGVKKEESRSEDHTTSEDNTIDHVLDGNANTFWYYETEDETQERYLVIDTQIPVFLSAIEYTPRQDKNGLGTILDLQVMVSMDGDEWTTIVESTQWGLNDKLKVVEIPDKNRQMAKYIKLISNESEYGHNISAAKFELFEDLTLLEDPKAEIIYSTTDWTNEDVTATISGLYEPVYVTNNQGSYSYTFTENDIYVFQIQNLRGNTSKYIASVQNIDKITPTAEVIYSSQGITVTASLTNASEDITVYGYSSYTFVKNGRYTFTYTDRAGNIGQTVAVVDSIGVTTNTPVIPEVDNSQSGSSGSSGNSQSSTTTPDITLNIPSASWLSTASGTSSSTTSSEVSLDDLVSEVEVYEGDENLLTSLGTLVGNANSEKVTDTLEVVEIEKTEELDVLLLCVQMATILSFLFISYKYYNTRKNNKGRS